MINRIKDARDRLYYTVRTKEDFANSFFGALVPTYVDSLPLGINQWTYIDELQAARVNVDEGTNGWIRFSTGELGIGDVINVSVEVFNISGTKAKLSVDDDEIHSLKYNAWETLNMKYVVREKGAHFIYAGIWKDDVGEFMMRNIKCEVLSQRKLTHHIIESGENQYGSYIKFSDGTMICRGETTVTAQINMAWGNVYYYTIGRLTFPHAFAEIPYVIPLNLGDRSITLDTYGVSQTDTGIISIYRPVTDNQEYVYRVGYIAIGRWK